MIHLNLPTLLLFGAILFLNPSCTALTPTRIASNRPSGIELKPCNAARLERAALCAKYSVYEDRTAQSGRTIPLNIVILPATDAESKTDAIFFLAGGPGQGAGSIANNAALFAELRRERDVVFVDLRGTGESHRLACPAPPERAEGQSFFGEILEPSTIRACRDSLDKIADLKHYGTANAVADLEEVRAALNYDKINLYGVSYGTLAAFEYLRRYPERVRAAALAGVLTAAAKLPLHFPTAAELALQRVFEDCHDDESCRGKFPDLRGDFAKVLAGFERGPIMIDIEHPTRKARQSVSLSRAIFSERVRALLHSHSGARVIPLLIHDPAHGNWTTFGKIAAAFIPPSAFGIATGVYYSVTCGESVAAISEAEIGQESQNTFLGDYRIRRHHQACEAWPRGALDPDIGQPVASTSPILMLSGDSDPATPMSLGKEAMKFLPNARQIILRNTPHSYTSECARSMIAVFISRGEANAVDASCAARQRRPPFVTELPVQLN
ncbi:MAG: alpha/beta fold hydrolase [Deltaproteobacteria bacterium]|nr:alpha/beta fold hydrolase [Deltaproteobacteria bacterium]